MSYLKHRLGRTFYVSKGRKNIPLIALHGGPGSGSRLIRPLLNLAKDRRVVVYDQLGCGKSSATPPSKWDMKVFVEELELLAKGLGIEEFFLFGVSCGATLALEYYLKYPKRVRAIVFQSPFFSAKDWQKDANVLIKRMDRKNRDILLKTLRGTHVDDADFEKAKRAYYLKHVIRNAKLYDRRQKSRANSRGGKVYEYMWGKSEHHASGTLKSYERGHALARVKVPALVICGEHDEATPARGKKYAKKLPYAKFKEVRGASHAISAERPKKLLKLVKKFLDENS